MARPDIRSRSRKIELETNWKNLLYAGNSFSLLSFHHSLPCPHSFSTCLILYYSCIESFELHKGRKGGREREGEGGGERERREKRLRHSIIFMFFVYPFSCSSFLKMDPVSFPSLKPNDLCFIYVLFGR